MRASPAPAPALAAEPVPAPATAASDEAAAIEARPAQPGPVAPDALTARYVLPSSATALAPGQRVVAEVAIGAIGPRKLIERGAVVYDAKGDAFVFVATEPLAFLRSRVVVDYIDGDIAVLREGPPAGTKIAIQGATELYGTENRIGGAIGLTASF